ncbi:MAG: hypothetical protein QOK48_673 [Blastocatellia bacterium]|jgi:hypothetical protein|nr:hypothetical protein [Blastocatellia bacterium]
MRHHLQFIRAVFTAVVLFSLAAVAAGQEVSGSISGKIKDANGAAVAGATVTITDSAKKIVARTVTTDDDGVFSAENLATSLFDITVEAPNFKKHIEKGVKVDVGQKRNVEISLEAGAISEVVTVEAAPLAVELRTPTASTVISGDQARELSLNNRNWVQLVTLAPGVSDNLSDQVYVGTTNPSGQANTINISVNGARSAQNTYTVDGADITDRGSNITIQAYPSVDSIGEFVVLRSMYPAETGRSGGGQINVVTKSGGDHFHGSIFEFHRSEKLNANDFLSNTVSNPAFGRDSNGKANRSPFKYNNFGGTLGGPIYLPLFGEGGHSVKRLRRTFFFFSEEQRKDLRYPTLSSTVPDLNMRQGIFPMDICLSAFTAASTGAVPCTNVLPAGTPLSSKVAINPIAQQYLSNIYNGLPLPTDPVTRALLFPALNKSDFRQEILKIDHSFNDRWSMYYRYEHDKIPTTDVNSLFSSGSGLPGVSTTATDSPGKAHTFQSTYVARSNLVVVGRFTYGYGAILSHNIGTLALSRSPITPALAYTNTRDRVPTISGNGFSALQSFGPYDNFSYKANFAGDVAWTKGTHAFKFGMQYSLYRKNENALAGSNEGTFSGFLNTDPNSAQQTSVLAPNAAAGEANATRRTNFQNFANFLIGNNVTFTQAHFDYTADLRQKAIESYFQDEWRLKKNLTIYYGVRHSYFGSPYDKNGRLSTFDPRLFNPAQAPLVTGAGNRVVGTGNFCNGMIVNAQNYQTAANNCTPTASPWGKYVVKAPWKDFGPRFGIAWDPFGKGTSSVRLGYGIYYDQVLNGTYEQNIGQNPPYQETFSVSALPNGTAATTPRLDRPVPSGIAVTPAAALTALSIRAVQPDWKDPYMQHWSLDLQHQFGKDGKTMMTAGYFGSKGTHLIGTYELNEVPAGKALATLCATGASTTPTVPCQNPGAAFTSTANTAILDQIRPYRGYRSIAIITPQFNSNYNSLQISAQRRFTGASQIGLAYTWSKNLTDNQTDRSTAPQNSYNNKADYGRATLDRRHVLTISYIYELPFYRGQHDFAGKLLGGWQVSGLALYRSGVPFTPATSSFDAAGLGLVPALVAGARPNALCDPNSNAPRTLQQYFNTACFQANPTVTTTGVANVIGNASRGAIDGPTTTRFDLTLAKNIRLGETMRVQLRAEAFNVLNHTNFQTIIVNVTSATYGNVTVVRDPRTIQLGAKFIF